MGVSVGVKFNDAELIGIPTIIVIGKKYADGQVELRDRFAEQSIDVSIDEIVATVKQLS